MRPLKIWNLWGVGWEAKAIATMQKEEPRRDDRRLARQGEVRIDRSEIQDGCTCWTAG